MKRPGPNVMIEIRDVDIEHGRPRDSRHCMIAKAIERAVPQATFIAVDLATIRWTDLAKGERYVFLTPRVAQNHLVKFDKAKPIEPIAFRLSRAQVSKSGAGRARTPEQLARKAAGAKKKREATKLERTYQGEVPTRLGGDTPPLQTMSDGVPFSRRRAYGLRGLEL